MISLPPRLDKGWRAVADWLNGPVRTYWRRTQVIPGPGTGWQETPNGLLPPSLRDAGASVLAPLLFQNEDGEWRIAVQPGAVFARSGEDYFKETIPTIDGTEVTEDFDTASLPVSSGDKYFYLKCSYTDKDPFKELDTAEFVLEADSQTSEEDEQYILWGEIEEENDAFTIKAGTAAEGPIVVNVPTSGASSGSPSASTSTSSSFSSSSSSSKDSVFRHKQEDGSMEYDAFEVCEGSVPYFHTHFRLEVRDGAAIFPIDAEFSRCTNPGTMTVQATPEGPIPIGARVLPSTRPGRPDHVEILTQVNAPVVVNVAVTAVKKGNYVAYHGPADRILDDAAFLAAQHFWNAPARKADKIREHGRV